MTRAGWLKLGSTCVGLALFCGLVWLAGVERLWGQLRELGWGVVWFVVPSVVVYVLEAAGWWVCLGERGAVGFWRLFWIRQAGEALNNTLPSAYLGGEPLKYWLLRREGVEAAESAASVFASKTALTVGQAVFVAIGAALTVWVQGGSADLPWVVAGVGLFTGLGALCVWVAWEGQRRGLGALLERVSGWTGLGAGWVASKREGLRAFDAKLTGFYREQGWRFMAAVGLGVVSWSVEVLEVWVFVRWLGLDVGWAGIYAIGAFSTVAKGAGFFIPGSLGAQEGGNVVLFLAFGLSEVSAVTYSLLRRVRELVWVGVGLLAAAWLAPGGIREAARAEG